MSTDVCVSEPKVSINAMYMQPKNFFKIQMQSNEAKRLDIPGLTCILKIKYFRAANPSNRKKKKKIGDFS